MGITRRDVADLREGDVAVIHFPSGSIVRGPLVHDRSTGALGILDAGWTLRMGDGEPAHGLTDDGMTLELVSRAPRPLYVNHPRTEPVPGDVVRDADRDSPFVWMLADGDSQPWIRGNDDVNTYSWASRAEMPTRLRLLVDGETGQVVP